MEIDKESYLLVIQGANVFLSTLKMVQK